MPNRTLTSHGGWTDKTAIPAFTPERVQSILTSRRQRPPSFLSLFYLDAAKLTCAAITDGLEVIQTQVIPSRALTNDEIGALMDHMVPTANIALAYRPFAVAFTLLLAWRGRASFRFPFWQPKWVGTSPDVFPSITRPLLYKKAARFAWHASRLVIYGALCNCIVAFSFLSYAHATGTRDMSSDPRLRGVFEESVQYQEAAKRLRLHQTGQRSGPLD